jgi:hypothetical protein
MKKAFIEDNILDSDKTNSAERLAFLRIQEEIIFATEENFCAI